MGCNDHPLLETAMTKKHFERFAKMLRETENPKLRKEMADKLIPIFKEENERFNEALFRKAANV